MSRRIEIQVNEEGSRLVERAKETARKHGAQLTDNGERGQFGGKGIEGTYEIEGGLLAITISKKPLILPWAMIEKTVRKFFA